MAIKWPEWAEVFSANIGNGDPNREEPTQAEKNTGWTTGIPLLQQMNWIQNNLAYWVRVNNKINKATNNSTLLIGSSNTVLEDYNVLLPADPLDGQHVKVAVAASEDAENSPPQVLPNGKTIQGCILGEGLFLDINNGMFNFIYDSASSTWEVKLSGQAARGTA